MSWLKSHWRWTALNLFAVSVLAVVLTQGSTDWNATHTFDPMLESGKWAMRFLLICLAMTPLNTYFGWGSMIKLRKSAGLWAFGFAVQHVLFYIGDIQFKWLTLSMPLFIALGLAGFLILAALALTSNRRAMQRLGKNWKRLHRLVYFAGLAVAVHAVLAAAMSKKMHLRDPQAIHELRLYLALLVVLLVVRLSLVRRALKQIQARLRPQRKADLPVMPLIIPDHPPEYWPIVSTSPNRSNRFRVSRWFDKIQPEEEVESQRERVVA